MFSTRTRWDLEPSPLARELALMRAAGARVLDLTDTNPTRVGLVAPESVLALLADPAARAYEPSPLGALEARTAVAADFARRGAPLDPERVLLTASTSEAYAFVFKLLCDPGDDVLVPAPGYPLFDFLAGLEGVSARAYPLAYDGEWHLDVDAVRRAVGPRTRAVVVVSPGNPTGAYLKDDERGRLVELAAERGLALVSDEVFADFALREASPARPSLAHDTGALGFTLGGLSKSCGLPQLKLAWTAVTGPLPAREEALSRLEVVGDSYLSVSTPVQLAAAPLLARQDELRAPILGRVRDNLGRLRAAISPRSTASLLEPEGGWSAVLRVPGTQSDEDLSLRLLRERGVLVHPGELYRFPSGAFLVLSLLVSPTVFQEGFERILEDLVL